MANLDYELQVTLSAKDNLSGTMKSASHSTNSLWSEMAKGNLAAMGVAKALGMASSAVTSVKNVIIKSVGAFAEYERSLRLAGLLTKDYQDGITGLTGPMSTLDEAAKQVAATSLFSSQQMIEAFEEIAAIGDFTADQVKEIGTQVAILGQATGMQDLEVGAKLVAATMNQFNKTAADAGHIVDVYARAANVSALRVEELGEALKFVGPLAGSSQISMEEMTAALVVMSNSGLRASQTGRTLRSMLLSIVSPTAEAKATMDQYGITMFNEKGEFLAFGDIISQLQDSLGGLSTQEKQAAIAAMFNTEAVTGVVALMDQQKAANNGTKQSLQELTESFREVPLGAQELSDIMMNSTFGALEMMKSQLMNLTLVIGEAFAPIVKSLLPVITAFTDTLTQIMESEGVKDLIATLAKLITTVLEAVKPLIPPFIKLVDVIAGTFASALEALMPVLQKLIDAFVTAFVPIIEQFTELIQDNPEFIDLVVDALTAIMEILTELMPIFKLIVEIWLEKMKFYIQLISLALEILNPILQFLADLLKALHPTIKMITDSWIKFRKMGLDIVIDALNVLMDALKGVLDGIMAIVDGIINFDIGKIAEGILGIVDAIWDGLTGLLDNALHFGIDFIGGILDGMIKGVQQGIDDVVNFIGSFFGGSLPERGKLSHVVTMGKEFMSEGYLPGIMAAAESDLPPTLDEIAAPFSEQNVTQNFGVNGRAPVTVNFESVTINGNSNDEISDDLIRIIKEKLTDELIVEAR